MINAKLPPLHLQADREDDEVHQFYQTLPELGQTQFQRMHPDGRYSFGYAHEDQGRAETRDQDGTVTGTYFYVDADGNKNQVFPFFFFFYFVLFDSPRRRVDLFQN